MNKVIVLALVVSPLVWLLGQSEPLPTVERYDWSAVPPLVQEAVAEDHEAVLIAWQQIALDLQAHIDTVDPDGPWASIATGDGGSSSTIMNILYAAAVHAPVQGGFAYVEARAAERGVTAETDPTFYSALNNIREWAQVGE